jgi:carboxypeptidase Taq
MTEANLSTVAELSKGYNDLKFYFANLNTMFSIRNTLAIDMMTAMPAGSLKRRINDISSITKRIYAETTTPTITDLLNQVEADAKNNPENWSDWDKANLVEMRRIHSHLSALPPELYIASVQVANEGRKMHAAALKKNNWEEAQPYIEKVVDLYRKIGALKQKKFDTPTPYRALLMGYASDISDRQMDDLYEGLLSPLKDLYAKAIEKQKTEAKAEELDGDFSKADQMWLNQTVLEIMGFDFNRGGLHVSNLSPMTGGNPEDVRILIRCGDSNNNFLDSLEDTLYQGARGLYYQNLPNDWITQPAGQDLGSIMLNSLSFLYSTVIGRTPQFFDFISVRAEGVFRQFKNKSFEPENLYQIKKLITQTSKRNEADELSKIFHDILRYRIERDLINGDLEVKDIPERWNAESKDLLGIEPTNLAEGALQNPDWFTGRFGFIPTNTLSHMIAAQLHETLYDNIEDLPTQIQKGNISPINDWLKDNIHNKGRSSGTFELIKDVTGKELSSEALLKHLERRYLSAKR